MIRRRLTPIAPLAALAAMLVPTTASAELAVGAKAPDFTAQGALAGNPIDVSLAKRLKKGPVVLYFYPKAFTQGCTLEAHAFAEATDDFAKAGASVVAVAAQARAAQGSLTGRRAVPPVPWRRSVRR